MGLHFVSAHCRWEPILWSDIVRVARPWTKWGADVERAADLRLAVRRSVRPDLMPPNGSRNAEADRGLRLLRLVVVGPNYAVFNQETQVSRGGFELQRLPLSFNDQFNRLLLSCSALNGGEQSID